MLKHVLRHKIAIEKSQIVIWIEQIHGRQGDGPMVARKRGPGIDQLWRRYSPNTLQTARIKTDDVLLPPVAELAMDMKISGNKHVNSNASIKTDNESTITTDTPVATPALVPWPRNVTFTAAPAVVLKASSRVLFASPTLARAAAVLAEELLDVHGLSISTAVGVSANPGDVLLMLMPAPPPKPPPPPVPPKPPTCTNQLTTKLNNTLYTDPNGPRTTTDADACCALWLRKLVLPGR